MSGTRVPRLRGAVADTLAGAGDRLLSIAVSLVVTPLLVSRLGLSTYGVYAIFAGLAGYVASVDLGLSTAISRAVGGAVGVTAQERARRISGLAFVLYVGAGAALVLLAYVGAGQVAEVLAGGEQVAPGTDLLLMALVTKMAVYLAGSVFESQLVGLQQVRLRTLGRLAGQATFLVVVVARVDGADALAWLGIAEVVRTTVPAVAAFGFVAQRFQPLASPIRLTGQDLRATLAYGSWMQINAVARVVNLQTDVVVLGFFAAPAVAGVYDIGTKIAALVRLVPVSIAEAVFPRLAQSAAAADHPALVRTYVRFTPMILLVSLLAAVPLAASGGELAELWVGHPLPGVTLVIAVLGLSYTVNNATAIGTGIVRARGEPFEETRYALLGVGVNVLVTIGLAPVYGLEGVLAGTACGAVVGSVYFTWRFERRTGARAEARTGRLAASLVAATGLAGAAAWATSQMISNSLLDVLLPAGAALLVLVLVARGLGIWRSDEVRATFSMSGNGR